MRSVIFGMPRRRSDARAARAIFSAPFQSVHVDIAPGQAREAGLTAGLAGLGCEFFSDEDGTLSALTLDMNPYALVDTLQAPLWQPVYEHIRHRAMPGDLALETFPRAELIADAVWLGQPFGRAIWSFGKLPLEPLEAFVKATLDHDYTEVGDRLIVGVHRPSGALSLVLAEGFDLEQQIYGLTVREASHDRAFMDRLNAIHWNFYADAELPTEAQNPMEALLLDPTLPALLRRLITSYLESLSRFYQDTDAE